MAEKHVITIRGCYDNIRQACEFVVDGARLAGLNDGAVFHVELACDEACTNIIEHAYDGEDKGDIEVNWWVKNGRFMMAFRDNGRSFDPADVPAPAISELSANAEPEDLKVGGLGIHFMRNLMDDVQYNFDQAKGNTLTMIKKLQDE